MELLKDAGRNARGGAARACRCGNRAVGNDPGRSSVNQITVVVHQEPLLPTNDHSNLSGSDRLRYRAATCWHVGGLSCSVSEDASHNHDSNETGNYAANAPFPVPRIIWVPDAIIVSVRHD